MHADEECIALNSDPLSRSRPPEPQKRSGIVAVIGLLRQLGREALAKEA